MIRKLRQSKKDEEASAKNKEKSRELAELRLWLIKCKYQVQRGVYLTVKTKQKRPEKPL